MKEPITQKPKLLIFDVNETLLDLQKIKSAVEKSFEEKHVFSLWFSTLLQYAMMESINHQYHSFAEIGKATLHMTARKLGKELSDDRIVEIMSLITQLPPHPDVSKALSKFKFKNFRMVALTNGSSSTVTKQMGYAKISKNFERLFSVEEVQSYKPQAKTYLHVLNEMNIEPKEAMLIAAHPWDISGAKAVGIQTAFIERPSQEYYPLLENADFMVKDLEELLNELEGA